MSALKQRSQHLWKTDARLTAVGLLMIGLARRHGVGLVVDPRIIGGAPAWLKPAKFAASIAIFTPDARVGLHLPPRVAQDCDGSSAG